MPYTPKYPIPEKYTAPYDPSKVEAAINEKWLKSDYFNPDKLALSLKTSHRALETASTMAPEGQNSPTERFSKPWSSILPPPNANGHLHAGHALDMTLKDISARMKRMQGYKVLMVPGTDHAGFETQVVYERKLEKEGRSRFGMDRDQLYKEIYDFTIENKGHVKNEVMRIGMSCDWSREAFTLDPQIVTKVQETFIKMHADGLVYRGKRICNWCVKHQTSLSDLETTTKERVDTFYTFQVGPFQISTVRPETKFGDKYIVVHPDDARYANFKEGDTFEAEWINGKSTFTIVKDDVIDKEFGTGAMTITPAHSGVDFEIAQRHNLPYESSIDEQGRMMAIAGECAGMKVAEARKRVVEILREKGLIVSEDPAYKHLTTVCYKCESIIEPMLRDQWFVKMQPLAQMALDALKAGELSFVSEQFEKVFTYWMQNPIDWNISRQIVWGISIPAWFRNKGTADEEVKISLDTPADDDKGVWVRDADTFDTWFSSGQWPLLTLGYPDGEDFKTYYPTNYMETGRDLVFRWVPRMVIFGRYLTGKSPFKDVYLHGMVNDAKNQKMSKSKGNVLSPIELADEFGMDALRISLIIGTTPGNDMPLSKDKIRAYKKFANKLWNIARFILENTSKADDASTLITEASDQILLEKLTEVSAEVTKHIEVYNYHLAGETLYHYTWHDFADIVIEEIKARIADGSSASDAAKASGRATLRAVYRDILKLLHPFMPFITEELWADFKLEGDDLLIVEEWPVK